MDVGRATVIGAHGLYFYPRASAPIVSTMLGDHSLCDRHAVAPAKSVVEVAVEAHGAPPF